MSQTNNQAVDDNRDWLAYPQAMVAPIYEQLGFAITDGGPGWLAITLSITKQLLNKDGVLHGGMWTLIADSAMGGACRTLLDPSQRVVTSQMDFRWLQAISGEQLICRGQVLRRGGRLWHCTSELHDSRDTLVGFGSASFVVIARNNP